MKKILIPVLALALFLSSCAIAETSQTTSPGIIAQWQFSSPMSSSAVLEVDGKPYVFLGTYEEQDDSYQASLSIMDPTDPMTPREVGNLPVPGLSRIPISDIAISESLLFATIAVPTADRTIGLWLVDISSIDSPRQSFLLDIESLPGQISLSEQLAFINTTEGTIIINISNRMSPYEILTMGIAGRMVTSDSMLSVVNKNGFHLVDVSTPTSPEPLGFLPSPSGMLEEGDQLLDVVISGQYAYVAYGLYGLVLIDISDPMSPVEIARMDTPVAATKLLVSGDMLYVLQTTAQNGQQSGDILSAVDVSDPGDPRIVDSMELPTDRGRIAGLIEDRIYITDTENLIIIDALVFTAGD
ncbi:LVIVD repeat-containing protein [Chloroflexota bacterium]